MVMFKPGWQQTRLAKPRKHDNPEGSINPLEKDIQIGILRYLRVLGAYGGKTKTLGVVRNKRYCYDPYLFVGFPDITFFWKDKLYFVEVKRKNEHIKPNSPQHLFQQFCNLAGITHIVARSVEDVKQVIEKVQ